MEEYDKVIQQCPSEVCNRSKSKYYSPVHMFTPDI